MAACTLNYQLCPKKQDGSRSVRIRMTYLGQSKYYRTSIVVSGKEVTPKNKIKKGATLLKVEKLLNGYRSKVNELDIGVQEFNIDFLYRRVFSISELNESCLDFIAWARKWCEDNKDKPNVEKRHAVALRSFIRFKGEKVYVQDMTTKTMKAFEKSLTDAGLKTAKSTYPSAIKFLFKQMRDYYNDYDNDDIIIRDTMASYTPPKEDVHPKRALTVEEIRKVFACPYDNKKNSKVDISRHDLALDCFRLSFCLMGMNAIDLYNCTEYDGEYIVYNRTKTKNRRDDKAEMRVKVLPVIKDIFDKYLNKKRKPKQPLFTFHKRFVSPDDFSSKLNKGLKQVGTELGIDKLTFYAARHSMATIAVNDVGISPYTVSDMLCHVETQLRVTNLYIKKDWNPINDANKKLIIYMFAKKFNNLQEVADYLNENEVQPFDAETMVDWESLGCEFDADVFGYFVKDKDEILIYSQRYDMWEVNKYSDYK